MLAPSEGWMEEARCAGMPVDSFVPPDGEDDTSWYEGPACALALRICSGCPVRVACFKYALEDVNSQENGVFGGTTPEDRRRYLESLSVR